ncbi:hypothetical protein KQI49_17385 [Virgibacillus sp. MSJ-26]|uniref:hypothetical protein n=1 Tax=Virgibacillus sp. MSJ-26 TaxID=2841522 RepID=UPI001C0FAC34|nr:hypothetical protein [Virgibacillus sp. MSJ-26]MBU5468586.1 hypothetical protein [Virgibacillus sp. MSJ-26]
MYKGRLFIFILRIIDWMDGRRQEIHFILMTLFVPIAIGFGVSMYIYYLNNPMFKNPSTIIEHFAKPIFIGMITVILILAFGLLLAHLITMTPFRRLKIFKMEMEFDAALSREKHIANQFLFSSTMLHNHIENVRYLLENNLFELKQLVEFLAESYKNNALEYNNELTLVVDVVAPSEIKGREKRLFQSLINQRIPKANTVYNNRLIRGENLLIGHISISDDDEAVMIVRRGYEHPFDIYDQETFESILGYASILFDTITMLQVLNNDNILTEHKAND